MNYLDIETYQNLYAKYLERPVSELIDIAGDIKGKTIWDLCCGGGELSKECLNRGAQTVFAIDQCSDMTSRLKSYQSENQSLILEICKVESWLENATSSPDFVFCRQGVNYWLNENTARQLCKKIGNKGVFIFNTFNTKPSESPTVKAYGLGGRNYVEVSWLIPPDMVNHVQIKEGEYPHFTSFKWISQEQYFKWLGYTNISIRNRGATTVYICDSKNCNNESKGEVVKIAPDDCKFERDPLESYVEELYRPLCACCINRKKPIVWCETNCCHLLCASSKCNHIGGK